jgi:hypothetical protein
LVLNAVNGFTGGLTISQGTINAPSPANLGVPDGGSPIVINDANTGVADAGVLVGPGTISRRFNVGAQGSGVTTIGSLDSALSTPTVFQEQISLGRSVRLVGENAGALPANHDSGQTRFDGPIIGAGGVTIAGSRMVQFRTNQKSYAGVTHVAGGATLSLWDNASTPLNSTVDIDFGATVALEGLTSGGIGGLSGPGFLYNNPAYSSSQLAVGGNNADTSFSGQIGGTVQLAKIGMGTLELGTQNNNQLRLTVSSGRVRLLGDQSIAQLTLVKANPAVQSLDLAGYTMRFNLTTLAAFALEYSLGRNIGTSADGIYDSTAAGFPALDVGVAFTSGDGLGLRMKMTIGGDANLDGAVGFADLVALAQNYNTLDGGANWDDGDFTHDGNVDFADLVRLAQNYNRAFGGEPVPGAPAGFEADMAAAFARVPEPSGVALAGLVVVGLVRRVGVGRGRGRGGWCRSAGRGGSGR